MAGTRGLAGSLIVMIVVAAAGDVLASSDPKAGAVDGWNRYVAAVEQRRRAERPDASRFLALDFDLAAASERRALIAGEIVTHEIDGPDGAGDAIDVPDARVHHWRGAIFLPRVTLSKLMASLAEAPPPSPDLLRAAVLRRDPAGMRVFLRLQRTRFVTVVYDTEHEVRFTRDHSDRASSISVAVKIAEVTNAGTPGERELTPAEDHGYLWRLNAYWRYQAVAGGVIAECESVSLSRRVPFGLQSLAGPLIRSAARESMERTLEALRSQL
ncbi:MAG: hypothetical protein ABI634_03080 [Acidobacteriota bacterium]